MKNQKIKLIWDFKGEDSEQIAQHHTIHIDEFAKKENVDLISSGVESINSNHHIAFLIVNESEMIIVRDALIPHRGEYFENHHT